MIDFNIDVLEPNRRKAWHVPIKEAQSRAQADEWTNCRVQSWVSSFLKPKIMAHKAHFEMSGRGQAIVLGIPLSRPERLRGPRRQHPTLIWKSRSKRITRLRRKFLSLTLTATRQSNSSNWQEYCHDSKARKPLIKKNGILIRKGDPIPCYAVWCPEVNRKEKIAIPSQEKSRSK